jgi:hypothetical protein
VHPIANTPIKNRQLDFSVNQAGLLNACSDAGHPVTPHIDVFSDNIGDAQATSAPIPCVSF